jgi:uncharacterized protein YdeI (YjbR/CyaY-like superfamily)
MRRVEALEALGRMRPAGRAAHAARRENRSGIYAYEQREAKLPAPFAAILKKNEAAWSFFAAQPASYRKTAGWWVVSAKRDETRWKRLTLLIEDSARGKRRF